METKFRSAAQAAAFPPIQAHFEYAVKMPNTERPGKSSAVIRSAGFVGGLIDGWDVNTLHEAWLRGVRVSGNKSCMGVRDNGGDYKFITYNQANERIENLARGMKKLDLVLSQPSDLQLSSPCPNVEINGKCFLGLFASNCMEWVICEQAANSLSVATIPIYDTLGTDACRYIIDHTQTSLVCCSRAKFATLVATRSKSLKTVILFQNPTDDERQLASSNGLQLLSLLEVEKEGQDVKGELDISPFKPTPLTLATICFTSGTTGDPKGAMLTHRNIIVTARAVLSVGLEAYPDDFYLSYLPLAHMFERLVQVCLWRAGATIGFYRGDVQLLMEDILALKPTIFASVPRLFNRIYDKVMAGVNSSGAIKSNLFRFAFDIKRHYLCEGHVSHAFWDSLVFRGIREKLGGRVRVMVTGSAPIGGHVLEFLRICFSCHVLEGYGQTETAAVSTLTGFGDTSCGHVGGPLGCTDICLEDIPEMGYFASSRGEEDEGEGKKSLALPRGEVCYRGPNVFVGYFHDEEKTKEAIDSDGWLHSGDVGELLPNGSIRIIDRKKNIFKLAQGEYVAPEKIESVYVQSSLVLQCYVHGDSLQASLVGIIVPDAQVTKEWLKSNGFAEWADNEDAVERACQLAPFKSAVFASMKAIGQEKKLKGFEVVRDIFLEPTPFSLENDLLTPTFKLKRQQARTKYRAEIDKMYQQMTAAQN